MGKDRKRKIREMGGRRREERKGGNKKERGKEKG